jgi:acyl transferase domain-containing protein
VRAEGCGVLVLKRYADAVRDGDHIQALIRGSALNNDGAGSSFGTPNARALERVIREAVDDAGVEPERVSYVEAHGTGTEVGSQYISLRYSTPCIY